MATDVKEEARLLKEEGNTAFKNKRYYTAVEKYSKSLEVFTDPVVLSNRAQAELNTNLNILAQIDCTAAIELDPSNVKCYYRRAQALRALGLFELAFKDANKCLELSKTDKSMQKLVDELRGKKNVAVLETCPIRRDDYIQSQEKFTDVEIEFADVSNAELKKEENKVHVKTTKQIPFIPKDYQDFVAGVTYLKDDSMLLAEYFLNP
uniref:Uncharacterized protein n=1 Tax=Caenorhabditis japonica TaxID=281687 RepID=A0A8R1DS23_CAEJA